MRARCGGGAAAWVAGVLATPGSQGSWRLGQQEIRCSRRAWQPVLASMLSILAWRTPLPDREAWQATGHRVATSRTLLKGPCVHRHKAFFACGSSASVELSVKAAQLLGLRGPWRRQGCRDTDCLRGWSYGPIRAFFSTSCSWRSEGLHPFGHLEAFLAWGPSLLLSASGT